MKNLLSLSCLLVLGGSAYAAAPLSLEVSQTPAFGAAKAGAARIAERTVASCSRIPRIPDLGKSVAIRHEGGHMVAVVSTTFFGPGRNRPARHERFVVEGAIAITTLRAFVDVATKGRRFSLTFQALTPDHQGTLKFVNHQGQHETWKVACR
ncbi:MAG: hypothetical protein HY078_02005 [Elusimicrobia bacterium]|nr:hypothetical protein [Elusimicrobiota bacterium]